MTDKPTCSERVYHSDTFRSYPCGRKGKVEVDGEWYCGIHDPVKKAAQLAHADAVYDAKRTVWDAEANLRRANEALIEEALLRLAGGQNASQVAKWRAKLEQARAALRELAPKK